MLTHFETRPCPGASAARPQNPPDRSKQERLERAAADHQFCRIAIAIAGAVLDIEVAEIARPNRASAPVCEARHIAMYLAHVVFQVSLIRAGRTFGRDRTSIAHAVRRIEDGRDDPAFDAKIERLETLARSIARALCAETSAEARS
ncbi:helix-turn-helix domain-containing protein [Fulvimarina sp. 2208YS6-2-32]|uniref:Helix-turn-helix domain-containing protein n=1 Tax=Fulvimarina uroteuthidis TaxID=3098149 RepID=A0ABU5I4X5_9HYPH|nr:helix-turn-helix domain-containing protein [Fulvimarina sp. 2208YS6-2-32]MDY8109983.1 helix-turn-helix domain-containing protein [Fulvimarina sp. 2208YS6-2-32]